MTDDPRTVDQPGLDARGDAAEPLPTQPPRASRGPRFAPFLDSLAVLILLTGIGTVVWLSWSVPPLERVPHPHEALALVVSTSMDLEEALEGVPDWEYVLFEAISGETGGLDEAIEWYEELARHSNDHTVELELAILEGESGDVRALETRLGLWRAEKDPVRLHRRLIEAAYLDGRLAEAQAFDLQAELAELLPAGWFYDRVAIRLAERADNHGFVSTIQAAAALREEALLARARALLLIELLLLGAGVVILVVVLAPRRRDPSTFRVGGASIPPRWSGRAGLLVLLRGGAAGVLVTVGFVLLGVEGQLPRLLMVPLINLPVLWLAYHHLFRPNGVGFSGGLGLRPLPARWSRMALVVAVLSAAGLVVDWVVALIAEPLGLSLHWTDWFDPELVWGGRIEAGLTLIDYLVFAPVFEEIVFRGILFGTLRRRFSFLQAALVSGVVFALAHGYGPLGLVSVCTSGVIWAWGYERTRSLLPVVLAHFFNNLLVCSGLMLMLR